MAHIQRARDVYDPGLAGAVTPKKVDCCIQDAIAD
jgi:hypothetical protein